PEVEQKRDQLRVLEREHERLTAELADLRARQKTADPRVAVKKKAFVPTEKEYSRPIKFALAGGVGVFGLVVVGLCLGEPRTRCVYTSDDLTRGLGLRVLGTVPALPPAARNKSAAAQSLGGLDSQYGLTEAIDAIRTLLLHSSRTQGARVLLVASAVAGE